MSKIAAERVSPEAAVNRSGSMNPFARGVVDPVAGIGIFAQSGTGHEFNFAHRRAYVARWRASKVILLPPCACNLLTPESCLTRSLGLILSSNPMLSLDPMRSLETRVPHGLYSLTRQRATYARR